MHVRGAQCLATKVPSSCASVARKTTNNGRTTASAGQSTQEQGIWISDELLGAAMRRYFRAISTPHEDAARHYGCQRRPSLRARGTSISLPTCGTRRHGSNIPGPLEAQRRLSKRRLVGLAYAAGPLPGAGADPIALFGREGPKVGQMIWEAPDLQRARGEGENRVGSEAAIIPEVDVGGAELDSGWLERLAEKFSTKHKRKIKEDSLSTQVTHKNKITSMELVEDAKLQSTDAMETAIRDAHARGQTIWQQLEHAKTLEACDKLSYLQLLAVHARGDERVEFSQDAFQLLLDDHVLTFTTYALFLLDPALNHVDARNLTKLLDKFEDLLSLTQNYMSLLNIQHTCFKFGVVGTEEVHDIIRRVGRMSCVTRSQAVAQSDEFLQPTVGAISPRQRYAAYRKLLMGLKKAPAQIMLPQTIELFLSEICSHTDAGFQLSKVQLLQEMFPLRYKSLHLRGDHELELADATVDWFIQSTLPQPKATSEMTASTLTNVLARVYPKTRTGKPPASCLPPETLGSMAESLLVKLKHGHISRADRKRVVEHFLFFLHPLHNSGQLNSVLDVLSQELSLSDMSNFLKTRKHGEICQIILRFWLPKLSPAPGFETMRELSLHYDGSNVQSSSVENQASLLERNAITWGKTYSRYCHLYERSQKSSSPDSPFVCLLLALHSRKQLSLQAQSVIIEAMRIVYGKRPGKFVGILEDVRAKNVYLYPVLFTDVFEHVAFQEADARLARRLIELTRVYTSRLAEVLPGMGSGFSPKSVRRLLGYEDPQHLVPLSDRTGLRAMPSEKRNRLVHDLAHAFSRCKHHNLNKRFANVHQCYRYLRMRQSPIKPTMTRALVRSAITAPLSQWQYVHDGRITWILDLVAEVEGLPIATELDTLVWRWRNNVQQYRLAHCKAHGLTPPRFGVPSARQAVKDVKCDAESATVLQSLIGKYRPWAERRDAHYLVAPVIGLGDESVRVDPEITTRLQSELADFRQRLHDHAARGFARAGLQEHFDWQGEGASPIPVMS